MRNSLMIFGLVLLTLQCKSQSTVNGTIDSIHKNKIVYKVWDSLDKQLEDIVQHHKNVFKQNYIFVYLQFPHYFEDRYNNNSKLLLSEIITF